MSRLTDATSAYLRSAAHQPVDWHPWSREAFDRARETNRPILLDVGAVWCHWCHVMDRESYEDPDIADRLNSDWICIKVDRDERPDVDARYQRAVQALTGQGGWPLTAFLTPDGDVFFGGTYFPPDNRHGRPGFGTVLDQLRRLYAQDPDRVAEQAGAVRQHVAAHASEAAPGALTADILEAATSAMRRVHDPRHGGFGSQPKFPHSAACDFLLSRAVDTGAGDLHAIVERTLTAMARGGIHDQLGGGFHRYSVDARWIVPHFEKMSYDNSELLRAYVHAASSFSSSHPAVGQGNEETEAIGTRYFGVVEGIVRWVNSTMVDPDGGYYGSQDADVGLEDDGDYFTWSVEEVRAAGVTDDEFAVLARHYGLGERGEMHHDPHRNVLHVAATAAEIAGYTGQDRDLIERLLASGREKMRAARAERTAPFVDTALYTGWNAMMASAMLEAGALLDRPDLDAHALRTLERFFADAAGHDGADGVRHALGTDAAAGMLEDQVLLAAAALDAWEATGAGRWLDRAVGLMEHVWSAYRAPDGGLYDRAGAGEVDLLSERLKPVQDAPTPSPNGVAALVLGRLAAHTGDGAWADRQAEVLEAFAGVLGDLHVHGATALLALDWNLHDVTHVVVVAEDDAAGTALHRAARASWRPRRALTLLRPGAEPGALPEAVRGMLDGVAPRAYVCTGTRCETPADSPEDLERTLTRA